MSKALSITAVFLLCLCSQQAAGTAKLQSVADSDTCLPELPPDSIEVNGSAPTVLLQLHNSVWLQNLSDPDWAPRTESNRPSKFTIRSGSLFNRTLPLIALRDRNASVQVRILTDGFTLCMSGYTLYMNISMNGTVESSTVCSNVCFTNITSIGRAMNLPLLVLNNEANLQRSTESLAVDVLDPDGESQMCMGMLSCHISDIPDLWHLGTECGISNPCILLFDGATRRMSTGCRSNYAISTYCRFNLTSCNFDVDDFCPVCCFGKFCNKDIAEKLYERYGAANFSRASSMLVIVTAFFLLWLRS